MTVWSREELKEFLAATQGDRLYAMWVVLLTTGLRRAEVAGLRWSDVDLDPGTLTVRHTRVAVDYQVQDSEPKDTEEPPTLGVGRSDRSGAAPPSEGPAGGAVGRRAYVEGRGSRVRPRGRDAYHPGSVAYYFQKAVGKAGLR